MLGCEAVRASPQIGDEQVRGSVREARDQGRPVCRKNHGCDLALKRFFEVLRGQCGDPRLRVGKEAEERPNRLAGLLGDLRS